ncbi:DnaJ-like protein subfamily A member 5 [Nematocida homosporus]|uniref:DnaJ-like protein subfamily A member 5 n=1 Tax=Nematocida homosporus TaxID=1912981 RepID=UPI00221EC8BA|nr:DnaJ-like protein subfamily A member 5 [Nematocida homosporus]KAI5184406.1 DnaJ-like protein subfamily A member 5 [Nematocida homosporus]
MGQRTSTPFSRPNRAPHEILGVSESATKEELKKAYRKLALEFHPDSATARARGTPPERFTEIKDAYDTLCNRLDSPVKTAAAYSSTQNKYEPEIDLAKWLDMAKKLTKIGDGDFAHINNFFDELTKIERITRGKTYHPPSFGYAKGSPKGFYDFYASFSTLRHFNLTPYGVTSYYDTLPRHAKREIDAELKRLIGAKRIAYAGKVKEIVRVLQKKDPRLAPPPKPLFDIGIVKPKITKKGVELKESHVLTKEELAALEKGYKEANPAFGADKKDAYTKAKEKAQLGSDTDIFICEPCKKAFKSINQLTNHANSKKHKDKLASMSEEEIAALIHAMEIQNLEGELPPPPPPKPTPPPTTKPISPSIPVDTATESASVTPGVPLAPVEPTKPIPSKSTKTVKSAKPAKSIPTKPTRPAVSKPSKVDLRSGAAFALSCAKCKKVFESRNQLFAHLKESNHGQAII